MQLQKELVKPIPKSPSCLEEGVDYIQLGKSETRLVGYHSDVREGDEAQVLTFSPPYTGCDHWAKVSFSLKLKLNRAAETGLPIRLYRNPVEALYVKSIRVAPNDPTLKRKALYQARLHWTKINFAEFNRLFKLINIIPLANGKFQICKLKDE